MLDAITSLPLKDPELFRQANCINGQWVQADSGKTIEVRNPSTGAVVGRVPAMGAAETRRAIEAAHAAQKGWRAMLAKDRAVILRKLFELMLANTDDLAAIMTAEQGKPLAESKGEIAYAASFLEWFAEEGKRVYGDTIPTNDPARRLLTIRQPVGVAAAITPWNFPSAMILRKAAPALAAGCPMIIKPAEDTPLSATALAELADRAGVPAGVLSVVCGDPETVGAVLTADPAIRVLSFTGSTAVGKMLMARSAGTVKRVALELGGNAPFIVFDDADLDAAVDGAMLAKFRNSGEACTAANRFLVHRAVADEFAARVAERVRGMKVGRGTEDGVQVGPLIDGRAVEKVGSLIADAVARGAVVRTGGQGIEGAGTFFQPTVVSEVPAESDLFGTEIFGPVLSIVPFDDEDDAVALANSTEYGLAAYVYTRDLARGQRMMESLETGMLGLNAGVISNASAPFGGVKQSGLGREGGVEGIQEYLTTKYTMTPDPHA